MKKLILTTSLLLSFSLNTFAGGGSADTGGGNAVGNQLLDLFENTGTTKIDLLKLPTYQKVVLPILEKAEKKVPGVTKILLAPVKEKVWLFDTKPLSRKNCTNSSMIEVAKSVVGCQNSLEVRLYKPWYDKVDSVQQAALILHEIFRGLALQHREHHEITDEGIAFLTRTFLQLDQYSEQDLVDILEKTNVEHLAAYSEYVSLNQKVVIPTYRKACMGTQRSNIYEASGTFSHVSMNGTYTDGERHAAFTLSMSMARGLDEDYVRSKNCKIMSDFISTYQ